MATPQLSPGILVREVDFSAGRVDNVIDNIGAIAAPFEIGPVEEVTLIANEQALIDVFGKPSKSDNHYEHWLSASEYLAYGGLMQIVRVSGDTLNCANAGVGIAATTTLNIKNYEDYLLNFESNVTYTYAAKNAGTWGNNLKVCTIDDYADQTIGLTTTNLGTANVVIGYGVTQAVSGVLAGAGSTSSFSGYMKGIITGVSTGTATDGSDSTFTVKVQGRITDAGVGTTLTYAEGDALSSFSAAAVTVWNNAGVSTATFTATSATDWYDSQTLGLTNGDLYWKSIAPKPTTSVYANDRQSKHDEMHVVVVDDNGSITNIKGNILEKFTGLSKALDAVSSVNSPDKNYYKTYLADRSEQIWSGYSNTTSPDTQWGTIPASTAFTTLTGFTKVSAGDGVAGQNAQGVTFGSVGAVTYTLTGGKDYSATDGSMAATLGNIISGYSLFSNEDEVQLDYLIMGPGGATVHESQAKANKLIAIAESRKDCVACVGPHRTDLVGVTNTDTQTDNLIKYFSPISSSSYAVIDSGYKFMYDRFNSKFQYVPCNADVAGLMCRTGIESYPWYSPAGQARGVINNSVKLAYNPSKAQRDRLYPARINSFITEPTLGTVLWGDKTALGYASAFDRINVRRLFLAIEQTVKGAADAQLFEINDEMTRSSFVNVVEPYLRDVQAKRGLYGFSVVCDGSNNTPDIIDNNEFRADIYLKPTKTINYITLTFVATKTGMSFSEVTGKA